MTKYWLVAKLTLQEYLAYRLNFWLEIIGGVINMLAALGLWYFMFAQSQQATLGGYDLKQMITYLIGAGLINSFILLTNQGDEINDDIHYGQLTNFLIKPLSPFIYWLTRDFCRRGITFGLGLVSFFVISIFFNDYLNAPQNLLLCLVSVSLAALLHFLIFYLGSIIAFWLEQSWGPRFVLRMLMELASGALIPLTFFPEVWKNIFMWLPFKLFSWVPMQIYLGKFNAAETRGYFLEAFIWIAVIYLISLWVTKKGLKNYVASGS